MADKDTIETAPDFIVNDTEGRKIQLSEYIGKKNLMLVFNRGFK